MAISRRSFLGRGAFALTAGLAARTGGETPQRPAPRLTTREAFDPRSVPPYAGDHARVHAHIDSHQTEHLAHLQRWLRQPSVSSTGEGIDEMAALLRDDLRALGCEEAEIVPTSGHPGVFGFHDAGAPTTLVVYMMYDVQPVEPADWQAPPFEARLVDHELGRVLMARGATNQKGPERAFLNAVASILAVEKKLPVNLMIAADGEEEQGSPHYSELIDRYEARMRRADAAIFPSNLQDPTGVVAMALGVKGIVYFELEVKGGAQGGPTRAEIHGSLKAMVDSPVWRLLQALACPVSLDGNTILVPGYYDAIRAPTPEEQRLANGMLTSWDENVLRKQYAVERWIDGMPREEALLRLLFDTTLNVDGIWAGYAGPGVKTILPHRATAKLDSRLVPDQRPEQALRLIREHLDARGFRDVELRPLSGYPPAQTSVDSSLARAALSVYNERGLELRVSPRVAGSAPYYQFTERLGLPMIPLGLGHGTAAHAPNEIMLIEPKPGSRVAGLAEIEKSYVDLLYALAG
jgi:acetylornithine deacetylase/succinyl-diaminopimelate desuccinylase-like protein